MRSSRPDSSWRSRHPRVASASPPTTLPPQARLQSKQAVPVSFNQGILHVRDGWILSGTDSPLPNTDVLVRTDEHLTLPAVRDASSSDDSGNAWIWIVWVGGVVLLLALLGLWRWRVRVARRD